ncbi:MAG: FmdB family transcriptional regulator [candidate division Zixibacteria bacterium SM23_73]|nr:MAG: FmdB family transcriptional regulator [candidate division Zixibacteria bacterium SM23_73]
MPVYEYKCQKCGHKFEKLVFAKEKINCPKCKSKNLKKLFSVFATGKSYKKTDSCKTGVCPFCK